VLSVLNYKSRAAWKFRRLLPLFADVEDFKNPRELKRALEVDRLWKLAER